MSRIHIVGAGLAGLAAALRLADGKRSITIHESATQAGGRCRSYFDATLGMEIDNGNHLLLSGNYAAQEFLRKVGSTDQLVGPDHAEFAFVDLKTRERWQLRPSDGAIPWWIFQKDRRVPGTGPLDYFSVAPLLTAAKGATLKDAMKCEGVLWERLWQPFFLAALNTQPEEGAASLAARLMRETFAKGGLACRPLVAAQGLSTAFITPALQHLEAKGVDIRFERRLTAIALEGDNVKALAFGDETIALELGDALVLAVPAPVAASLLPALPTPQSFRAIVNAHYKIDPPPGQPPILGIINGTMEWLFAFPGRLSVTISGADRLIATPREELAAKIWSEIQLVTKIESSLPAWQIIKEKRATFAATPAEEVRRPNARGAWTNLIIAGDWTNTGLPATIEGAIRSGFAAADAVVAGK
jgi:squalene-associated FAD-dependent desaturase